MIRAAVLFSRKKSHYKLIPDLDVYDIDRDARTYSGRFPVVAHPPCRAWGKLRHMAFNVRPGEKELAFFALDTVRRVGGVIEHPKYSSFFENLPRAGVIDEYGGFVLGVNQSWWGHNGIKPTLLYIVGCKPSDVPPLPLTLDYARKSCESMCTAERERTPDAFAEWLVTLAIRCGNGLWTQPALISGAL